ncbi:trigger factor [Treponema primitia ZAS-2]|uniref:Trigger factor n=1 Tax=Treponema primitia (strain ATCC BAA-887 / DSM 12427 / ZAS-2) TaxID=545694 RepID=F5YGI9_TREPZ|nr:trigger factor [Treponema primitia]AEF85937.1 trigger factor [Treponema primitia ZAS-2]
MAITKEITRLEHSNVKLTVTVGKEDVRTQYDELLSGYSKNLQIPGFRKGKAPKDVLERKFGSGLKEEALGRIIEKSITDIFEDEGFPKGDRPLPYSTPQVEEEPVLALDSDLSFSVVYDVMPAVNVATWKGLEVEAPDVSVSEEDISRELETVRDRNAIVQDKEDGEEALKDDVVTVDYLELSEAGEPLDDTKREDFVFTLGSGYNLYKFDDEVVGMKKGESKDITKTYAEDFTDKDLAGKTIKLRITLSALKKKILPALDDDLAQDVDEKFKTLDDLKADIRGRLTKNLDKRLRDISLNNLLEKISAETPVEIPESMIRIELDSRWRNLARRFNTSAEELLKIMGTSGKGYEQIIEEWRPDVIKALHSRIIVEKLMEEQKLEASDDEFEKEIVNLSAETGSSVEDIKKYYEQENMKEYLKEEIKERKLFDIMLAENTIKKGKQEKYTDIVQQ